MADVVRGLAGHLRGLRGVNVSWDSARLVASDPACPPDWSVQDGHAISPPIGDAEIAAWPSSSCGFDEWYFFREVPATLRLEAFCNWAGTSLAAWEELDFPGGVNLGAQLAAARPELVIGQGYSLFVLSRNEAAVATLLELAGRA